MSKYFSWCCCFKNDNDTPKKVPASDEGSEMQMMNARVNPSSVTQETPGGPLLTHNILQDTVPEEPENEGELESNKTKEIGSEGQDTVGLSNVRP